MAESVSSGLQALSKQVTTDFEYVSSAALVRNEPVGNEHFTAGTLPATYSLFSIR
jgi:hypothetical protein